MLSITLLLFLVWGIAFIERVDALIRGDRQASVWSLVLVGGIVVIHILLLSLEGSLITSTP
jgi:hypothetical protein